MSSPDGRVFGLRVEEEGSPPPEGLFALTSGHGRFFSFQHKLFCSYTNSIFFFQLILLAIASSRESSTVQNNNCIQPTPAGPFISSFPPSAVGGAVSTRSQSGPNPQVETNAL